MKKKKQNISGMRLLEESRRWLGEITEIALLLIALGIAIQMLFGKTNYFLKILLSFLGYTSLFCFILLALWTLKSDISKRAIMAIRSLSTTDTDNHRSTPKRLAASVIYLSKLKKLMVRLYVVLGCSTALYPLTARITGCAISRPLLLLPLVVLIFLLIHEITIRYRIEKGYFGLNPTEARKMISFVLKNAEKIDFTDSSGKPIKTLLPIQEDKRTDLNTAAEGATA